MPLLESQPPVEEESAKPRVATGPTCRSPAADVPAETISTFPVLDHSVGDLSSGVAIRLPAVLSSSLSPGKALRSAPESQGAAPPTPSYPAIKRRTRPFETDSDVDNAAPT
jgi:hypothetical protein